MTDAALTVMGEVVEQTWTTIAADRDGVPVAEEIGTHETTRRVHFAYHGETVAWLIDQVAEGWTVAHGPTPCATQYHGPTDSPSNCWSAEVSRALTKRECAGGCGALLMEDQVGPLCDECGEGR